MYIPTLFGKKLFFIKLNNSVFAPRLVRQDVKSPSEEYERPPNRSLICIGFCDVQCRRLFSVTTREISEKRPGARSSSSTPSAAWTSKAELIVIDHFPRCTVVIGLFVLRSVFAPLSEAEWRQGAGNEEEEKEGSEQPGREELKEE